MNHASINEKKVSLRLPFSRGLEDSKRSKPASLIFGAWIFQNHFDIFTKDKFRRILISRSTLML